MRLILNKNRISAKGKYYIDIILTFLFVFGIPFTFLPINSSKVVLLFLLVLYLFQIIYTNQKEFLIKKDILIFSSLLIFLIGISTIYPIFHKTMDFSLPYAYIVFLFENFIGSYLLYVLLLQKYSFDNILHILIIITLLQALIIISMFVSEPIRNFFFTLSGSNEELMERYGGFRGFGLAGSVTYDLSVFLSIGMIFISYLISQNSTNKLFYIISWVFILFAILMTGRTGLIGVLFSLLILFVNFNNKNSFKNICYLIISIFLIALATVFILSEYYPETYNTLILSVIPYAFEMFFNFFENGSLGTSSSEVLQTMYFQVSEKTFFLGDGYWINPNGFGYYMGTDAGYMRHILYYGLFPSLFLYLLYIYGFYKIACFLPKTLNNKLLVAILCIYYFLVHYKGDFLTGSPMNIKLFCIILIISIHYNKKEEKKYDENIICS